MSVKIIAELAQGYEGSEQLAHLLVKAACSTKADAVKLQCVYADELAVPSYQYYGLFKQLEMPISVWQDIVSEIHSYGKEAYFDIFGEQGLSTALKCGVDGIKLHTTDFFNEDLTTEIFANVNKIFVSIGGIKLDEIDSFIKKYISGGGKDVCLMFGHQTEPTPLHENNINRLKVLADRYGLKTGFMDHSEYCSEESGTLSLLSLPLGVSYIEKHLTLDQELCLEDYISAITPSEFNKFIGRIRKHEIAMGTCDFTHKEGDLKYRNSIIKVVVAAEDIQEGSTLLKNDILLKRINYLKDNPATIYDKKFAIGKMVLRDFKKDEPIFFRDLK